MWRNERFWARRSTCTNAISNTKSEFRTVYESTPVNDAFKNSRKVKGQFFFQIELANPDYVLREAEETFAQLQD